MQDDAENENLYEFAETKSKKTQIRPSDRGDVKATRGNFGGQLRVVCEKNDSLIIKVKNETADSTKSPQTKTVTFMEPHSTDFIDYNEPRRSQKIFRETSKFRSGGGNTGSSNSSKMSSSRVTFRKPANYADQKYPADTSHSTYRPHGSSSVDKNHTKLDLIVSETSTEKSPKDGKVEQTEEKSLIENNSPQTFLKSGYAKKEELVGSGRLTAQLATKKQKNKYQRRKQKMFKSQQNKLKNSGEEVVLSVETTGCVKTNVNDEIRGKNGNRSDCERQPAVDSKAVSNTLLKHQDMPLHHPSETFKGNKEDFVHEGDKVENISSNVSSCVEAASVNCDHLDVSFDLDEDSPNGDQFDDEEWEDIDEEVCIDLINRGEDHFEDAVLDISDENFDKFISESVICPRNHVDWAAEMESMERRPSVGQCGDAKSVQQESQ